MLRSGGIQNLENFEHIGSGCIICCWVCCISLRMTHAQLAYGSQSTRMEFLAIP
jgi:hypothetical protein